MDTEKVVEDIWSFIKITYEYSNLLLNQMPRNEIVFRGQSDFIYGLKPSLFREQLEKHFEYNQIHFLKASKFVEEDIELEIAIRAQHYGYLTRLLDVTYNSLVALYFSCLSSDEERSKDGSVYIISIEKYLPPTAYELTNFYSNIIVNTDIFETLDASVIDPIIIENIKNNDRIIAQSGAFLLFFNQYHKVCDTNFYKIKIKNQYKEKLLKQLDQLFKINYGSLFPDIQSNSKQFNTIEGRKKYVGMGSYNIYEMIIEKSLQNYLDKKLKKINDSELELEVKSLESSKIKRFLDLLIDGYYMNKTVEEKQEMKDKFQERIKYYGII